MKRDFVTTVGWTVQPSHMENPYGYSLTVPDQSLSLKEILEKSIAGMDLSYLQRLGLNSDLEPSFDNDDLEKFAAMDWAEREELLSQRVNEELAIAQNSANERNVAPEGYRMQEAEQERSGAEPTNV